MKNQIKNQELAKLIDDNFFLHGMGGNISAFCTDPNQQEIIFIIDVSDDGPPTNFAGKTMVRLEIADDIVFLKFCNSEADLLVALREAFAVKEKRQQDSENHDDLVRQAFENKISTSEIWNTKDVELKTLLDCSFHIENSGGGCLSLETHSRKLKIAICDEAGDVPQDLNKETIVVVYDDTDFMASETKCNSEIELLKTLKKRMTK
jgi:hypothetical protein